MNKVLRNSRPKARKNYTCNACEWIANEVIDNLIDYDFTLAELKAIVRARRNHWQIVAGQQYIYEARIYEGHLEVWRAIPEIDAICRKHHIYEYIDQEEFF